MNLFAKVSFSSKDVSTLPCEEKQEMRCQRTAEVTYFRNCFSQTSVTPSDSTEGRSSFLSLLFNQPPAASHTHLSILLFLFLFMQSTKQQVMKAMDMRRMTMELTTEAQTATRKPWISKGDRAGEREKTHAQT